MYIVGLTGGIGSGKSTIARVFESLGVPVFYADEVAKSIYTDRPDILVQVMERFGGEIISHGQLNRRKLSEKVFGNSAALQQLNAIVHPAVAEAWQVWKNNHRHFPYIIREAAILIESGSYQDCDEIILITTPEEQRIKRIKKRDGATETEIQQRMASQWDDQKKIPFASTLWVNDDKRLLLPVLLKAHATWSEKKITPSV